MNRDILIKRTPEVLRGAEAIGLDLEAIGTIIGASQSKISEMFCGLRDLSTAQGRKLETKTGRSVGQLALLGIEAEAPPRARKANARLLASTHRLLATLASDLHGIAPERKTRSRSTKRTTRKRAA